MRRWLDSHSMWAMTPCTKAVWSIFWRLLCGRDPLRVFFWVCGLMLCTRWLCDVSRGMYFLCWCDHVWWRNLIFFVDLSLRTFMRNVMRSERMLARARAKRRTRSGRLINVEAPSFSLRIGKKYTSIWDLIPFYADHCWSRGIFTLDLILQLLGPSHEGQGVHSIK